MRNPRPLMPSVLWIYLACGVVACGGGASGPTVPSGPVVQSQVTVSGSVEAGGRDLQTFPVDRSGPVVITLTALSPPSASITATLGVYENGQCIEVVSVTDPPLGTPGFAGRSDAGPLCIVVAAVERVTGYVFTVRFST